MARSIQAFCLFALFLTLATAALAHSDRRSKSKLIRMKSNGRGVIRRNVEEQLQSECTSSGRVCHEVIDYTDAQFTNNAYIEVSVQVKFVTRKNLVVATADGKKVPGKVLRFILPARPAGGEPSVTTVFTMKPVKAEAATEYALIVEDRIGSNKAKINTKTTTFRLPFSGKFKVAQGFNGRASHTGKDAYSIDFTMPEGTRILAARDGVVISTVSDQWRSKFDPDVCRKPVSRKCDADGSEDNNVNVGHSDGTYAQYAHLQQGGVSVNVGDSVTAGQLLGFSGNTGYSKGAHLHISINRASSFDKKVPSESLKVTYTDVKDKKVTPKTGSTYEGAPEA